MTKYQGKITEKIKKVQSDLAKYGDYHLTNLELDELRFTGRITINVGKISPHLPGLINYLHSSTGQNAGWIISLNTVSTDIEISLTGSFLIL
ncbi:hypothetical protein AALA17_07090 [Lactobacillaceae bacterium 24-114]